MRTGWRGVWRLALSSLVGERTKNPDGVCGSMAGPLLCYGSHVWIVVLTLVFVSWSWSWSWTWAWTDHSVFAGPDFDPAEYASAVLAGDPRLASSTASVPASPSVQASTPSVQASTRLEPSRHASTRSVTVVERCAREDVSVAIVKMDVGIEDVGRQIKALVRTHCYLYTHSSLSSHALIAQVTAHHEELLQRASDVRGMSGSLASVRRGLDDLESSIEK